MHQLLFSNNSIITGWSEFDEPNDWYGGCRICSKFPDIMKLTALPVNLNNIPHL